MVGVLPEFFMVKEITYDEADELVVTKNMRERKAELDERSDAFIALPGGVGTLEEIFEILSMKQLKLTLKPFVFLNIQGYYDKLISQFRDMVDLKFAKKETLDLFAVAPDPDSALDYILTYQPPPLPSKWL